MTFEDRENSAEQGEPIELYRFIYQNQILRYTNAQATSVTVDLQTWEGVTIDHTDIEHTGEMAKNDITLTVLKDFPMAEAFKIAPPSSQILLTIYQYHVGDPQDEFATIWSGRVLNCEWKDDGTAELGCENIYTSLRRPGLRRRYQRQCQHSLYNGTPGSGCAVNRELFKTTVVLTDVQGTTLTGPAIGAQPADWFPGGYVDFEFAPGFFHRRSIRSQDGNNIVITHPIDGLVAGMQVFAFAGCDHIPVTCRTKFDNLDNYGGFPNVPRTNPFGQVSVF